MGKYRKYRIALLPPIDSMGVYQIRCKITGDCYIGVGGFRTRCCAHIRLLQRGRHFSQKMQAAWNEYGENAFEFSVVEALPSLTRLEPLELTEARHIITKQPAYNTVTDFSKSKWRKELARDGLI